MKITRLSIIVLSAAITNFLFLTPALRAQEREQIVILSDKVGESIDSTEREYYRLFPLEKNFVRATFYIDSDSAYFARMEFFGKDGIAESVSLQYSDIVIFQMAEKINHYEDLLADKYTMGRDPAVIQIAGGPSLRWSPPPPRFSGKVRAPISTTPTVTDSNEVWRRGEWRLSVGYGLAKGGYPSPSYDRTYTSLSQSSTIEMSNVNDKYYSAGEGIRFECQIIGYVSKQMGLFLQGGYSSGSKNSKKSSSYIYTASQNTSSTTADQTVEFRTLSLLAGLHFRVRERMVEPYIGAGAGLFFSSNLTSTSAITYDGRNEEQENTLTTNIPVGYMGYVGINVDLHPQISLFAEAKTTLVSFYIKRQELTKYIVDGKDQLQGMKARDKVVTYDEDKNYKRVSPGDEDQPQDGGPPPPLPANIVGLTMGISLHF